MAIWCAINKSISYKAQPLGSESSLAHGSKIIIHSSLEFDFGVWLTSSKAIRAVLGFYDSYCAEGLMSPF